MHRVHEYRHQHEAHDKKLYCSRTLSSPVKAPPLSLLFLLLLACMAFKLKGISFTSSSGRLRPRYSSKVHPLGMTNDAYKHVGMLASSDRCKILLLLHWLTALRTKCINKDKLRQVCNSPPPPNPPPLSPSSCKINSWTRHWEGEKGDLAQNSFIAVSRLLHAGLVWPSMQSPICTPNRVHGQRFMEMLLFFTSVSLLLSNLPLQLIRAITLF